MTNEQLSSMLNALKGKHDPIAHKIASGAGIDMMYVDSKITEQLISTFTHNYKCPILTVHDSYIVPFGYVHFLKQQMQAAFEKVRGISGSAVDHTTQYYDFIDQEPNPDVPPSHHDHYAASAAAEASQRVGLIQRIQREASARALGG